MSDLLDRTIRRLAALHEQLTVLAADLPDDVLTGPSAATEWRLCDVFSHLGSGAEIGIRPLRAALGDEPEPIENAEVWARWDAASPREQVDGFVEHDAAEIGLLASLTAEQRAGLLVDLDFLPAPVPLVVAVGMRLNEVALHTWDIDAGLDPAAIVDEEAAELLIEHFAGPLGFLLGFSGKGDALREPAVVAALGHGLAIEEDVTFVAEPPSAPTATFTGRPESLVRLMSGRLGPDHTPDDVAVSGNLTLDDLRRVFPGY